MRGRVRSGAVVVAVALASCTGGPAGRAPAVHDAGGADPSVPASSPLPFGIVQPDGVVPVGRPAAFEEVRVVYDGVPVTGRSLVAAYRVTAGDPAEVVRDWAAQLGGLGVDRLLLGRGAEAPGPWMYAVAEPAAAVGAPGPSDHVDLQVWATDGQPVLVVDVHRVEATSGPPRVTDDLDRPGPAPHVVRAAGDRGAGDPLLTEQGHALHLPAGTRALLPTLPIRVGTGGSFSVLAADDGAAAVAALVEEAREVSEGERVLDQVATDEGDTRVVRAGLEVPAGGWSLDVVAVEGRDDPYATVYVRSGAD